jgi:serine/threonine-protein kinase
MIPSRDPTARLGPFDVIETAYRGRLFVVERCRDRRLRRELAVKRVRPDSDSPALARAYALREARVRALVAHGHVLPLLALEWDRDDPLLVGPWLGGGSLLDLRPPISPAEAVVLADSLGSALDALHAKGWCHGDVSPGNVLFDLGSRQPVLADLGNARRLRARASTRALVVTPHVTAPEVWAGDRVDGRADLYSLGALLYWALTGAWPFDAPDAAAFAGLHRWAAVPRLVDVPFLEGALLRALEKAPEERYATGAELAGALRDALARPVAAPRPRSPSPRGAGAAAGERLEGFAQTLDEREQAALRMLLRRSAVAQARARDETEQIAMQLLGPAAALVALEECGAAAALAAGHETPEEVSAACGAPAAPVRRLLELLAAVGVLGRNGNRYRLPAGPAALYGPAAEGTPLRDAASFWAHLPRWAATGEPLLHMDRPDGALYVRGAEQLGRLTDAAARELGEALAARAVVPAGAAVLDVGAGAGAWGFAVAAVAEDATVTAVDRPGVLERTAVNARAAGLDGRFRALAGDWRDVALPPAGFDVAVLANICHLEPEEEVRRLLRRANEAVRSGGVIAVVDTMPEAGASDLGALLQSLHLALRTPGGGVHERVSYAAWLEDAGFEAAEAVPLAETGGRLTALVARRAGPS